MGSALTTLFEILIVTGSFACVLAFYNTSSRYFFSMGREGILPRGLGKVHPTHRSPYIASDARDGAGHAVRGRVHGRQSVGRWMPC